MQIIPRTLPLSEQPIFTTSLPSLLLTFSSKYRQYVCCHFAQWSPLISPAITSFQKSPYISHLVLERESRRVALWQGTYKRFKDLFSFHCICNRNKTSVKYLKAECTLPKYFCCGLTSEANGRSWIIYPQLLKPLFFCNKTFNWILSPAQSSNLFQASSHSNSCLFFYFSFNKKTLTNSKGR